jgi:TolB-like protein/Flp pilus assembly protein TadD
MTCAGAGSRTLPTQTTARGPGFPGLLRAHTPPREGAPLSRFIDELKRRRVGRVTVVYAAVAFMVVQVTAIVAPALHLPPWTTTMVVLFLALGFPVAIVLAWAFELTPEGVRRTVAEDPGEPPPELLGRRTLAVAGGLVLTALLVGWSVGALGVRAPGDTGVAETDGALDLRKIAVLPFRNANPGDEQSETLALGVHDDLLTRLSRVGALRVVSRTSVMEYAVTRKSIPAIGLELGVGTILEGGVQRVGGQVRINVQLIDTATDEHLWAETFDRPWSLENLFAIQTEIAERVARALEATLTTEERASLAERPTADEDAYHLYVRARQTLQDLSDVGAGERTVRLAELAVARDSGFAHAFALLGHAHAHQYWYRYDHSPDRLERANAAIQRALALAPDLPEAHIALGLYRYWGRLDYDGALRAFARAGHSGRSTELEASIGYVRRRQGHFEEALEHFQRAHALDPRSPVLTFVIGETLVLLGRFAEAEIAFQRALELAPLREPTHQHLAMLHLQWRGDLVAASRALEAADRLGLDYNGLRWLAVRIDLMAGDPESALQRLATERDSLAISDQWRLWPTDLLRGEALALNGDPAAARERYALAVERLERMVAERPGEDRIWSALGLAYAGLGRKDDAVRAARRGVELLPVEREAWRGAYRLEELARVYAAVGEPDLAIDVLEELIRRPGDFTPSLLRLDPAWNPLRGHTRFRALARG